mmetsp:Transcript_43486/g.102126  ORF Transcript_43486/g.102126 Transcript_43486/m.102126 type:complete len:221 (-) Transcript_43486:371-1033(-)
MMQVSSGNSAPAQQAEELAEGLQGTDASPQNRQWPVQRQSVQESVLFGFLSWLPNFGRALTACIIPFTAVLAVFLLVIIIFASIGQRTWSEQAPDAFQSFDRAFYTVILFMSWDEWPDDLPIYSEDEVINHKVTSFIIFFEILVWTCWILLIKIVVTVLLHEFAAAGLQGQEDKLGQLQERLTSVESKLVAMEDQFRSHRTDLEKLVQSISRVEEKLATI